MRKSLRLKKRIRRTVENLFDVKISPPYDHHGYEVCLDIERSRGQINTIFDVGANVGQSALKFREAFPQAVIYCFEPMSRAFERLKANVSQYDNINCYPLALGSSQGSATIYLAEDFTMSSLIKPPEDRGSESIVVQTIDNFAAENSIERIDLLKIDAEGFDLEVLKGAGQMLSSGGISFVLAEVSFHAGDEPHVFFEDVRSFLERKGFGVFGVYDQRLERVNQKRLRFVNACFCNEEAFPKQHCNNGSSYVRQPETKD